MTLSRSEVRKSPYNKLQTSDRHGMEFSFTIPDSGERFLTTEEIKLQKKIKRMRGETK